MPKPTLMPEDGQLENDIIDTLLAGLKEWRPDLHYPESHSDMCACVRGIMRMFEIKRRPLAAPLRYLCENCDGRGEFKMEDTPHHFSVKACGECEGKGYKESRT